MKFLVDAQLPKRLSNYLNRKGHDSLHTFDLPRKNETVDQSLIDLSKESGRIVISKDKDFYYSAILQHEPIKLIMVTTGNIHNSKLLDIFQENLPKLCELIDQYQIIEVTTTSVTIHL